MIRLAIAIASACAVVWYAGGHLGDWEPAPETRAAIEQTAQVAREQAAKLLAPEEGDTGEEGEVPAAEPATPITTPTSTPTPAPAPELEPLEPGAVVEAAADFAPESVLPEPPGVDLAERGWDAPLDAAQAEAVRFRLDRVMQLAAGAER